jgi:hypothetical protein
LSLDLSTAVAPMPVAAGPLKLGAWLFPHWILAGFALGVTGAVVPALVSSVPSHVNKQLLPSASRAPAKLISASSGAPSAVEPLPSGSLPSVGNAPRTTPLAASPSATASNSAPAPFDAELKLISLAKRELDARHPAQALAWLQDHAQRFPNGVFSTEREALRVLAHCAQGPQDEALARSFAALHPGSPLITRLERACRSPVAAIKPSAAPANVDFSKLPNEPAAAEERTSEPSSGALP